MAPRWSLFVAVAAATTVAVVALARASAGLLTGEDAPARRLPPRVLLANVAATQGLLGGVLVAVAWYAEVPPAALGAAPGTTDAGALLTGAALGVVLYAGDEAVARAARSEDLVYAERLRRLLAPQSGAGWVVLLGGVLPLVAGFEELLFRAALVGVPAAGFGVSPWLAAAVSSALFGLAHGAQGRVGVAVTAGLGFALAAAFVLTGSLLVVVVAHYAVNALEFVVHEGLFGSRVRPGWNRD